MTDVGDRFQPLRAGAGLLQGLQTIVVARRPAHCAAKWRGYLRKALIGRKTAVLRKVAGSKQQVNFRLFLAYQIDNLLQAVCRGKSQQATILCCEQVRVGQLYQQYRLGRHSAQTGSG